MNTSPQHLSYPRHTFLRENSRSMQEIIVALRDSNSKIHALTNQATATLVANTILALKATPSLTDAQDEITQATASSDALLINTGTPNSHRQNAIKSACRTALLQKKPWVLDPVMIERFPSRLEFVQSLIDARPTVIKGNYQEIQALANTYCSKKETSTASDPAKVASQLAATLDTVIVSTGSSDFISDGTLCVSCTLGHPLQAFTTGMGCALGAVIAVVLTTCHNDSLLATLSAIVLAGSAATQAGSITKGPGSLPADFLDALYHIISKNDTSSLDKIFKISSLQLLAP